VKKTAGQFDGDRLIAVERKKPDAGLPVIVEDVSADVELKKAREPGDAWEKAGT
jgi:hypothetical protein